MDETIEVLRTCAALAHRLAKQLYAETARRELLEIDDDLDAEAYKLEMPGPSQSEH